MAKSKVELYTTDFALEAQGNQIRVVLFMYTTFSDAASGWTGWAKAQPEQVCEFS